MNFFSSCERDCLTQSMSREEKGECRRKTVENRLERLETRLTMLEELPVRMERVESQIVQLRTEMRDEFSAIRQEIRAGDEETRQTLGTQMRVLHEAVIEKLAILEEGRGSRPAARKRKPPRNDM